MAICTNLEQNNTVNVELLILCAKNLVRWVEGWKDGLMDGCKSRVKDCLQQSKTSFANQLFFNLLVISCNLIDILSLKHSLSMGNYEF